MIDAAVGGILARPEMARLTLARKIATLALTVWKKGEAFDPKKLSRTT